MNYRQQKLQKKLWPLLGTLFVLALSSCVSIPDVPPGETCLVWANPPSCLCTNAQTGAPTRNITLEECQKYIAVSPEYSNLIDAYHQQLIDLARRRCRQ